MIKKYVKKPITIEAIQWTGFNLSEVREFTKVDKVRLIRNSSLYAIAIPTLDDNITASPGDYIIKDTNGEFYRCEPDIFNSTYDEVTE